MAHEPYSIRRIAKELILEEYTRELPNGDVKRLEDILAKYSDDVIVWVAHGVDKIGIRTIMDIIGVTSDTKTI